MIGKYMCDSRGSIQVKIGEEYMDTDTVSAVNHWKY